MTVINHALCVGPCRPAAHGGARQIVAGSHLCEVCRDNLAADLGRIADAWGDLNAKLAQGGGNPLSEKVTTSDSNGLVINEHVSDIIHEVRAWVYFAARTVVDERGTGSPAERDIPSLLRWLAAWHVDWLSSHEDESLAGAFAIEARELVKSVRRTAYPSGARRLDLPMVTCKQEVRESEDTPAVPCGATMFTVLVPSSTRYPDLVCTRDETHRLTPATWAHPSWRKQIDPEAAAAFTRHVLNGAA